ncbi:hypothetical protein [Streptomyces sp. NPDC049813]
MKRVARGPACAVVAAVLADCSPAQAEVLRLVLDAVTNGGAR